MSNNPPWSHLPNAVHIDRILLSIKTHPEAWSAAWTTAGEAAANAARNAARDTALDSAFEQAWGAVGAASYGVTDRDAARYVARVVARDAIAALIAWDHSAKYLDMPSDQLRVWHALSEDPACVLLLPTVLAFERIKELELT